jgi:hypothetical protein
MLQVFHIYVAKVDLDVAKIDIDAAMLQSRSRCYGRCFQMLCMLFFNVAKFLSMLRRDALMLRRDGLMMRWDWDFFSSATVFDLTSTVPRSDGCACVRFFPLLRTSGR